MASFFYLEIWSIRLIYLFLKTTLFFLFLSSRALIRDPGLLTTISGHKAPDDKNFTRDDKILFLIPRLRIDAWDILFNFSFPRSPTRLKENLTK